MMALESFRFLRSIKAKLERRTAKMNLIIMMPMKMMMV